MEKKEIKFTVEKVLTVEDLDDIMTTAIEGGIGYWSVLCNDTPAWEQARRKLEGKGEETYYGNVAAQVLLDGNQIRFEDAEADADDLQDDEVWFLDMEKFKKGCALYEQNRGNLSKNLQDGDFDAVEADCLIQYALFGEVVFG